MSRFWKITIAVLVCLLISGVVGLWGLWIVTGRGAPIYEMIGWMCEDSRSYRAAAKWYERAVRVRPRDADLRVKLAYALWQAGDAKGAQKQYEEASRLRPDWVYALTGMAAAHTYFGEYDRAEELLQKALKTTPGEATVYYELGRLRKAQGRLDEAATQLRMAIDLRPDMNSSYALLGEVLEKQGQTDEAIKAYEDGASRGDSECRSRLLALGRTPPGASPATSGAQSKSGAPPAAFFGFMSVFFVMYFFFIGFAILLSMGSLVVTLLAIYDCARRDFDNPGTRALWCLLIAFTRWIGALVYYLMIYRKDEPPVQQARRVVPASPMQ